MTADPDMAEIVRHTAEYAEDRDMNFGEAAVDMAERLDCVSSGDIIQER